MATIRNFIGSECGSTAIEYGLIASVIGMGIILSLTNIRTGFTNVTNAAVNGLSGR